jgi:hypothetical protein
VLDGARLYRDVVEINPPLIVALNLPAVIVARALGVSDILVYRIGFTLALLGALTLSYRWLLRCLPTERILRGVLTLLLALALFPLADQDYGEREHLVLALLFPYFLLTLARAEGREVKAGEATVVGLLAGLAFALKPHFLLVWLAMEGYLRLRRHVRAGRPLPETMAIGGFLGVYSVLLILVTPQYLALVRLLGALYNKFLYDSFFDLMFTGPGAALTLFALLAFVALRKHARHPEPWRVLALATLACFVSGAAQQKGLRYHFYPAIALATILLGVIAVDSRVPMGSWVRQAYRAVGISVLVTTMVVVVGRSAWEAAGIGHSAEREQFVELVRSVKSHAAGESVFVMSYHIGSAYPLVNYSGVRSASRFGQLWVLGAAYVDALRRDEPLRYRAPAEMGAAERYLNRAVREDLQANRPKLILVLRNARDRPPNSYRRLDYVAYFGRDPAIAAVLRQYQWIANVGEYALYERLAEGAARSGPPPSPAPGTLDVVRAHTEGLHLRVGNPAFLAATLCFLVTLGLVVLREGPAVRSNAAPAQGAGGEPRGM